MTSKAQNLQYGTLSSYTFEDSADSHAEAAEPAFLRRLRGEVAGDGSGRHERPDPRKKGVKKDDDDDAPTYVLEDTNQSLTKAEYEALVSGDKAKETGTPEDQTEGDSKVASSGPKDSNALPVKDKIAEVGNSLKKRKVAKIIGGDEDDKEPRKNIEGKSAKKPKKKAKPVKLSFGDEVEG
jgi:hypothetical protein